MNNYQKYSQFIGLPEKEAKTKILAIDMSAKFLYLAEGDTNEVSTNRIIFYLDANGKVVNIK